MAITVSGDKELEKMIQSIKNSSKLFDTVIKNSALRFERDVKSQHLETGNTSRSWTTKKISDGVYTTENKALTRDKSHLIVDLLNDGNNSKGAYIYPKRTKHLYIPKNETGKSKAFRGRIPKYFIYGVDYILVKKVKAHSGSGYVTNSILEAKKYIIENISKKLDSL